MFWHPRMRRVDNYLVTRVDITMTVGPCLGKTFAEKVHSTETWS